MKVRLGEATQQDVDQYNNDIEEHTMTQVDNNTLIERREAERVAEMVNYSYPEPKNNLATLNSIYFYNNLTAINLEGMDDNTGKIRIIANKFVDVNKDDCQFESYIPFNIYKSKNEYNIIYNAIKNRLIEHDEDIVGRIDMKEIILNSNYESYDILLDSVNSETTPTNQNTTQIDSSIFGPVQKAFDVYSSFLFYIGILTKIHELYKNNLKLAGEVLNSKADIKNILKQIKKKFGGYVKWLSDRGLEVFIPVLESKQVRGKLGVLDSLRTLKDPGREESYKIVVTGHDKPLRENLDLAIKELIDIKKRKDEEKKKKDEEKKKKDEEKKKKVLEDRAKEKTKKKDKTIPDKEVKKVKKVEEVKEVKEVKDKLLKEKKIAKDKSKESEGILDRLANFFKYKDVSSDSYVPVDKSVKDLIKVSREELNELRSVEKKLTDQLKEDKLKMNQYKIFLNKQLTSKYNELERKDHDIMKMNKHGLDNLQYLQDN